MSVLYDQKALESCQNFDISNVGSGALRDDTKNGCVADYWHVEFQISKFQAAIFVEWKAPEVPLRQYGCF